MLSLQAIHKNEAKDLEHDRGPLEIGRGPARGDVPRLMVADPYVSKDHVRLEEIAIGRLRVDNLSQKQPIKLSSTSSIPPGGTAELLLPCRLTIGDTRVELSPGGGTIERAALQTIAPPSPRRFAATLVPPQADRGPGTEQLMDWCETVLAVQQAEPGTADFFERPARALVDVLDLDRGLVLLRQGDHWQTAARAEKSPDGAGTGFNKSLVDQVARDRRTFFLTGQGAGGNGPDRGVVAAPILDGENQVVALLYGERGRRRELDALQAQMVQVLASALGFGLLRHAKESAQRSDQDRGRFLADMGQELREPLDAILGHAELLQEQARVKGREEDLPELTKLLQAGRQLQTVLHDVLEMARLETGRLELFPETFAVPALVREAAQLVQPRVERNGNVLRVWCADDVDRMHTDATRLRQCLVNLLDNAAKFTRDGTITLQVRTGRRRERPCIEFEVSDTGIGMSPEKAARLFRGFMPPDAGARKASGGTGLGLALVRRFSELLGGEVAVRTELHRGSTFLLVWPERWEGKT